MKPTLRGPLADAALAWGLLTAIPLPAQVDVDERPAGRAAAYFPLVGLVLGGLLAGLDWLLAGWLPPEPTAALLLAGWVAFTGMLHLDGFMDSCDGLLPPRSPARRLEIMRDSRVGAFGVVGAVLLLLLKFTALLALPSVWRAPLLVSTPVLARWSMTWLMWRYPPARREGLSVFFRAGLGWPQILLASLVAGGVAWGMAGSWGLLLWAGAWLSATLLARLALARLGGLSGDIYGAACELTEAVLLLITLGLG